MICGRRISPDWLRKIGVLVVLIWGKNDQAMRFRIAEKASDGTAGPCIRLTTVAMCLMSKDPKPSSTCSMPPS